MKLVIDANEIFSFFNAKSKAREISLRPDVELFSPRFAIDEIKRHKEDVVGRFDLSEAQYALIKNLLETVVKFYGEKVYSDFIEEAQDVSPDADDVDFFALAMKKNCPIWSEDKLLKDQSRVRVYTTSELLELFGWIE